MFFLIFLAALWCASFMSAIMLTLTSASVGSILGSGLIFVGLSITLTFVGYIELK